MNHNKSSKSFIAVGLFRSMTQFYTLSQTIEREKRTQFYTIALLFLYNFNKERCDPTLENHEIKNTTILSLLWLEGELRDKWCCVSFVVTEILFVPGMQNFSSADVDWKEPCNNSE